MSWEIKNFMVGQERNTANRIYIVDGLHEASITQNVDGTWYVRLELYLEDTNNLVFYTGDHSSFEGAKNQVAQEVADKLAELSQVASALKDFKIEGK